MSKRNNRQNAVTKTEVTAVAAPTPPTVAKEEPRYIAVGPKRGLTGNGGGSWDNKATMEALMALDGAKSEKGLPLSVYAKCAADRNHKRFLPYAIKSGWLTRVPAPGSVLDVSPL